MNENYNRIPFGKEIKLEIPTNSCPGCNASRGQFHEYGCPVETCPQCGSRLLMCSCIVLSLLDEMRITKAVAATLSRKQVLSMADASRTLDQNYTEKAGFTWIIVNAPPQLEKEMEEMALEILGAKKQGEFVVVPQDKAAEVLGMPKEEADVVMRELEAECLYPEWSQHTRPAQ